MSKATKTTKTDYFVCDQCNYVISGCKTEADVAKNELLISNRGEKYHFHSKGWPHIGEKAKDQFPWTVESCFERWLVAQQHLEKGRTK